MEAEIEMMHLQAKECQGLSPENRRETWNRLSLRALGKKTNPANTLIFKFMNGEGRLE